MPSGEDQGLSVKDRTFKTRVGLKVGDILEAKSGVRIFYEREADSSKHIIIIIIMRVVEFTLLTFFFYFKIILAREGDVEIALSFSVKEDVDRKLPPSPVRNKYPNTKPSQYLAFSLGELSGSVKQILSLAKNPDFKYEIKCKSSSPSPPQNLTLSYLVFSWIVTRGRRHTDLHSHHDLA